MTPQGAGLGGLPEGAWGQLLEYLTSLGSEAVLVIDSSRRLTWASPNAARLLAPPGTGETAPAALSVGTPLAQVLEDPRASDLVGKVLASSEPQRRELRHSDWRRVLEVVAAPLRPAPGGLWVALLLTDITHQHRLTRAHQELIANLSHDLRTPLASLRLMAETLTGQARDDPEATLLFASRIAAEAERLHTQVEGILDLGRLEAGVERVEIRSVELRELAAEVAEQLRPVARERGLRLQVRGRATLALADPSRLQRALGNVLDNALKFTQPPGRVTVAVASGRDGPAVSVRDTGAGIPASKLPRIFDRFYTGDRARSDRSTGLGLTIAKQAVELQGGTIEVRSWPGAGTRVRIVLRRP